MATIISVLALIWVLICVPFVALRPKIVFYSFLCATVFDSIFNGYIQAANNLGLPQSWRPADFLFPLTMFAAVLLPRDHNRLSGVIHKCLIALALLTAVALVQGFVRDFDTALAFSRGAHIIAAVMFGLKYLTNRDRVKEFLRFTTALLIAMFALHVVIRFGVYTPPIVSELGRVSTQLAGERGGVSLVPVLYLVLMSIGTARLVSKTGFSSWSAVLLLCGVAGALLSENRSMYASVVVLAMTTLVFIKGRVKAATVYGLVGVVAMYAAAALNFDVLARFREKYDKGAIVSPLETHDRVRSQELSSLINSYVEEPMFILTGRGVGATHFLPGRKQQTFRAYYHSEYLMWLDRCGLLGLGSMLLLVFACLWRSYTMARLDEPFCRLLGVTCLLLTSTILIEGIFHPIFTHLRGGSLMICFAVILANWRSILLSVAPSADVWGQATPELASYGYSRAVPQPL